MVKKACSTFEAFLADVSRKGIPMLSANSYISSADNKDMCMTCTNLGNGVFNSSLVSHIALVADEELVDTLGGISVDFLKPLLDVVERIHICDIVDDADAMSTAVVGRSNGSESFLTGGVPLSWGQPGRCNQGTWATYDLQFHSLAVEFDGPDFLRRCQCCPSGVATAGSHEEGMR
jgi:hypothetical protein